jgi:hypothetical protein
MPTAQPGLEGGLSTKVHFTVPSEWEVPLPEVSIDPQPLVEQGYLGTHTRKGTSGSITTYVDFGVDFRGIVLATKAQDNVAMYDTWVAGFTVIDRNHPDIMYVLTMPIFDVAKSGPSYSINANGVFTADQFLPSDHPKMIESPELIRFLSQHPETVGRRMVISVYASYTNASGVTKTYDMLLAEAMQNGQIITGKFQNYITISALHIPYDLVP